jgi:hypothetical protein
MNWFSVAERVVLTLWVGGMWSIGYVAVPTLFYAQDDRQLAGELAGQMFSAIHIISLVSIIVLLINMAVTCKAALIKAWRAWVLLIAFALVVVSMFYLQPLMGDLKQQGLVEGSQQAAQFGKLHGISSTLYMVTSLAGLVLVIFGLRREPQPG